MPYFINSNQLDWGGKVGYIWGGSNAVTFSEFPLQSIPILSFPFSIPRPITDIPCAKVFLYLFLPEMRNRTLEEIDELFQERVPTRKFATYHCISSERAREQAVKNVAMEDDAVEPAEKEVEVEHREVRG